MDSYEINKNTCAVVSVAEDVSRIVEQDEEYLINKGSYEVMEDSCKYYGSSCDGRIKGTKTILGSSYKVPIIVEETNEIIFFPTESVNNKNCIWVALNNIEKFENCNGLTKVTFTSGKEMIVKTSVSSFEMQLLRANRLGSIVKKRREDS